MATFCLYDNDTELKQYRRAIRQLAEDLHITEEEIQIHYERMLFSFKERARIKDYLPILVGRNVKARIKGDTV